MKSTDVCPLEYAGSLDNRLRRFFQNPAKILEPWVKSEMTVMDIGCGPGYFTLDMANLVGREGLVVAADIQQGMLEIVSRKVSGTPIEDRVVIHCCGQNSIGYQGNIDFALAFYMVHEVPDQDGFFAEVSTMLNPGGRLLVVEPPFHVGRRAFGVMIDKARNAGLSVDCKPRMFPDKAVVFRKKQ